MIRSMVGAEQVVDERKHRGIVAVTPAVIGIGVVPSMEERRENDAFQKTEAPAHVRMDEKPQSVPSTKNRAVTVGPAPVSPKASTGIRPHIRVNTMSTGFARAFVRKLISFALW